MSNRLTIFVRLIGTHLHTRINHWNRMNRPQRKWVCSTEHFVDPWHWHRHEWPNRFSRHCSSALVWFRASFHHLIVHIRTGKRACISFENHKTRLSFNSLVSHFDDSWMTEDVTVAVSVDNCGRIVPFLQQNVQYWILIDPLFSAFRFKTIRSASGTRQFASVLRQSCWLPDGSSSCCVTTQC